MLKISLDFDSVLSDTMISWTRIHNSLYGSNWTKSDIKEWKFWKPLKVKPSVKDRIFRKSWKDWINLPPTESNLDKKIATLSEYGIIDVVTSVEKKSLKYVKKWLDRQNITTINGVRPVEYGKKINLSYDLFIDDDPGLANQANKLAKKCIIYKQTWNHEIDPSFNVVKVNDLTEACRIISEKGL